MSRSQLPIDQVQWKRIGRRRFAALAILITVNLTLLGLGINSHLDRASAATASTPENEDGQPPSGATESSAANGNSQTTGDLQPSSSTTQ